MQIAAIQMVSGAGLQDNLQAAAALLAQAAEQGAELALLPEYLPKAVSQRWPGSPRFAVTVSPGRSVSKVNQERNTDSISG